MRCSLLTVPGVVAIALVCALTAACGSEQGAAPQAVRSAGATEPPASAVTPAQVDVLTWWNYGDRDIAARDQIEHMFTERHPETRYVDRWSDGEEYSSQGMMERIERDGGRVDVYQPWGDNAWRMDDDNGQAADVSDLYDELGLRDALPRGLLDALTVDGKIYRVPVAVSGGNVLWSDRRVLADAGLDPDAVYASVDEWIVAMCAVKAAGRDPIALGPWWTRQLLLENVLLSELGRNAYQGLWDGSTSWDAVEVVEAFRDFDTVVSLAADPDPATALEQDWSVQADRFADHGAAFLVMGDWAQARFVAAHRFYRKDYDAVAMPGTEGSVLLAGLDGNTFAMRDGAPHPDGARAWLGVLASREGQSALARTLGEVPARTDVDPSGFDQYTREAMSRLREGTVIDSFTFGTRLGPEASAMIEKIGRKYSNHRVDIDVLRQTIAGAAAGGAR